MANASAVLRARGEDSQERLVSDGSYAAAFRAHGMCKCASAGENFRTKFMGHILALPRSAEMEGGRRVLERRFGLDEKIRCDVNCRRRVA